MIVVDHLQQNLSMNFFKYLLILFIVGLSLWYQSEKFEKTLIFLDKLD